MYVICTKGNNRPSITYTGVYNTPEQTWEQVPNEHKNGYVVARITPLERHTEVRHVWKES